MTGPPGPTPPDYPNQIGYNSGAAAMPTILYGVGNYEITIGPGATAALFVVTIPNPIGSLVKIKACNGRQLQGVQLLPVSGAGQIAGGPEACTASGPIATVELTDKPNPAGGFWWTP